MIELPDSIHVDDLHSATSVDAQIVELSRSLAQKQVDGKWWALTGVSRSMRENEDDHHWKWAKLVGEHRNDLKWESAAVLLGDGSVEGAMQYRIDALSFKEANAPAIFVDRLATAPHNRPWLVQQPHYRGIGEGLLLLAVVHSYVLGFDGCATLLSFDTPKTTGFYAKRGFETVGTEEGLVMMELTPKSARSFLVAQGYEL